MPIDRMTPTRSESVLLACTSPDARHGVFARVCRYPAHGVAWVWVHAFLGDRVFGFVDDAVPCGLSELDTKSDDLVYAPEDPGLVTLRRMGPRDAPAEAALSARVAAHEGRDTPGGAGARVLTIEARFVPEFTAGATLPGRSEVLGRVRATVGVDGTEHRVEGRGQWHEQHQRQPRFVQPFTYCSLRGEAAALIGLAGPFGSSGFVRYRDGRAHTADSVVFDGTSRVVVDADGSSMAIDVTVVHAYTLPIYGSPWRGHQVVGRTGDDTLSGFVNVWTP